MTISEMADKYGFCEEIKDVFIYHMDDDIALEIYALNEFAGFARFSCDGDVFYFKGSVNEIEAFLCEQSLEIYD